MDSEDCDKVQFHSEIICWTKLYSIIDCTTVNAYSRSFLLNYYKFLLHIRDNGCNLIKKYRKQEQNFSLQHIMESLYDTGAMIFDELYAGLHSIQECQEKITSSINNCNKLLQTFSAHYHVVPHFLEQTEYQMDFVHPRTRSDWDVIFKFRKI